MAQIDNTFDFRLTKRRFSFLGTALPRIGIGRRGIPIRGCDIGLEVDQINGTQARWLRAPPRLEFLLRVGDEFREYGGIERHPLPFAQMKPAILRHGQIDGGGVIEPSETPLERSRRIADQPVVRDGGTDPLECGARRGTLTGDLAVEQLDHQDRPPEAAHGQFVFPIDRVRFIGGETIPDPARLIPDPDGVVFPECVGGLVGAMPKDQPARSARIAPAIETTVVACPRVAGEMCRYGGHHWLQAEPWQRFAISERDITGIPTV